MRRISLLRIRGCGLSSTHNRRPDVGRGGAAAAERALQHDHVGPLAELVGDRRKIADPAEAAGDVQADGGRVAGIDIADHLPVAGGGAGVDQGRPQ